MSETLFDKRYEGKEIVAKTFKGMFKEEDVKEKTNDFLKELKECESSKTMGGSETDMILISTDDLDKLAFKHFGDKLINEK